jgi:DNA polymerase delta subunit 4
MRRWKRADGLGLKPPIEVLAVLMKEEKGGNKTVERAFMDGLLTSRLAVNE